MNTISFAKSELKKYLSQCGCNDNCIELHVNEALLSPQQNASLDDMFLISITSGSGSISGSNERSVLFGVYRFLYELGFRWISPGKRGERIPLSVSLAAITVKISESAAFRHRGIVIEGANSIEHLCEFIDWLPKLYFNSYFIQFKTPFPFLRNWYEHVNNPLFEKNGYTLEKDAEYHQTLIGEIKKRGLLLHTVGHGWTNECIGIESRGWDTAETASTDGIQKYLAQINGVRSFFDNIPNNTNLCYSSYEVQELFCNTVVSYIESHGEADYAHVWLADEFNNHCECENCKKISPTDVYVQMLNLLDKKLTAKNIHTHIVFLLYFELLWAPVQEKLACSDRFVLMFAPISRYFEKEYAPLKSKQPVTQYVRNKIMLPKSVEENLAFLHEWQQKFSGDSFDFDYHLARAHYGDMGYYTISRILSKDIQMLTQLGLHGMLACQEQRVYFPTAFPNYVMGRTLWNCKEDFNTLSNEYFSSAFGTDWREAQLYLQHISSLCNMDFWNAKFALPQKDIAEALERIEQTVTEFQSILQRNSGTVQWEYLKIHGEYCILFSKALASKARGETEKANVLWTRFVYYIRLLELQHPGILDVYRIIEIGTKYLRFTILS